MLLDPASAAADPALALVRDVYPADLLVPISHARPRQPGEKPFVTLTYAQSLDGKIAGKGGKQLLLREYDPYAPAAAAARLDSRRGGNRHQRRPATDSAHPSSTTKEGPATTDHPRLVPPHSHHRETSLERSQGHRQGTASCLLSHQRRRAISQVSSDQGDGRNGLSGGGLRSSHRFAQVPARRSGNTISRPLPHGRRRRLGHLLLPRNTRPRRPRHRHCRACTCRRRGSERHKGGSRPSSTRTRSDASLRERHGLCLQASVYLGIGVAVGTYLSIAHCTTTHISTYTTNVVANSCIAIAHSLRFSPQPARTSRLARFSSFSSPLASLLRFESLLRASFGIVICVNSRPHSWRIRRCFCFSRRCLRSFRVLLNSPTRLLLLLIVAVTSIPHQPRQSLLLRLLRLPLLRLLLPPPIDPPLAPPNLPPNAPPSSTFPEKREPLVFAVVCEDAEFEK